MATKEFAKGSIICSESQILDSLFLIASGSVNASFPGGNIVLKKGDVIGLYDIGFDSHFFTYKALEPVNTLIIPLKGKASLKDSVSANPEVARMVFNSMLNQSLLFFSHYSEIKKSCKDIYTKITQYYETYITCCAHNNITSRSLPQFDDFVEFTPEDEFDESIVSYYASIYGFAPEIKQAMAVSYPFLWGFITRASADIHSAFSAFSSMDDYYSESMLILLQGNRMDMLDLYTSVLFRLPVSSPDVEPLKAKIDEMIDFLKADSHIDSMVIYERASDYRTKLQGISTAASTDAGGSQVSNNYAKELAGSLDIILDYGDIEPEIANTFKKLINQYKKLSDKTGSDDVARKLRLELTKYFNIIYAKLFKSSIRDYSVPTIIKMFFSFGYVDEELAGAENASYLYTLADNYEGDETYGVYTLYEWLRAIYDLKKDPSRNEFDVDYLSFIHEQKVTGKITAEEEARLSSSPDDRLNYELENMFPTVNKVTYGRITSFCPVFSEHNVIKPLASCLVNVETIIDSIKKVNSIDYGAFYRETIYTNEKAGISKEFIQVKILPDVILFPNVGTRGVMWQEIEGRKRTTPARFMLSAFHLEDITSTFIRLTGEYRWEMCKRVQGSRWNDVSDRSLTSEYFDYIQFYRKNSELSADAKEKIKASLLKAKNSFKEMFVRDYMTWIMFEGNGSPRLNKLVRQIMCTYCPFPFELRKKVVANPLFKEPLERYEIKTSQKMHHFDNVLVKMKNAGCDIPNELLVHQRFIEGK